MSLANESIFYGKRVFVTGHTGFKGSWLALWLSKLGADVTGYALEPPTQPNHFSAAEVESRLEDHHVADIRDWNRLTAAMAQAKPDVVFHLAAQSMVRRSYAIPRETFDVNVMGSICVLDAVRALQKPVAVVMVTSDKCYENTSQVWGYQEKDALGEYAPYGASKGAAEIAIRSYRHSFFPPHRLNEHGVRLASVRAGNVLGGGDWTPDALIVDVVSALLRRDAIPIRSPKALRPWQHVLQCLSGYLTVASRLLGSEPEKYCTAWNIGPLPGNEIQVADVVKTFIEHWGYGESIDVSDPDQLPEANVLRLSIDKAIWELGWTPRWDIWKSLEKTAQWYQQFYFQQACAQSLSLQQIEEYESDFGRDTPLDRQPVLVT